MYIYIYLFISSDIYIFITPNIYWLVVWTLWKIWKSVGMLFHSQYMESHNPFHGSSHHQPVVTSYSCIMYPCSKTSIWWYMNTWIIWWIIWYMVFQNIYNIYIRKLSLNPPIHQSTNSVDNPCTPPHDPGHCCDPLGPIGRAEKRTSWPSHNHDEPWLPLWWTNIAIENDHW